MLLSYLCILQQLLLVILVSYLVFISTVRTGTARGTRRSARLSKDVPNDDDHDDDGGCAVDDVEEPDDVSASVEEQPSASSVGLDTEAQK